MTFDCLGTRSLSAAALLALPLPVLAAQPAQTGSDSASSSAAAPTDIVVSATRRDSLVQKVPISVQVIAKDMFERSSFKNPSDLQYLSPSVQVSASGGIGFNIRGVGTNSYDASTEQTVGLVIDGVVYGFVDDISADLSDVSRIEVLKGPQGTQFGKNASAGVVNVVTEQPTTDRLSMVGHVAYGSFNDTNASARINVPITSNLAGMLVGSFQNRDGWSYDPVMKRNQGDQQQYGFKGKLAWNPMPDLDVHLNVDYRRTHISPNFLNTYKSVGVGYGTLPPGLGVLSYGIVPSGDNTQSAMSIDSFRTTRTGGGSLRMNYHLGAWTLSATSALRLLDRDQFQTIGGTPANLALGTLRDTGRQISQEVTLTSPTGGTVEFVAGLYYYNRHANGSTYYYGSFNGLAEQIYGLGALLSFSGGRDHEQYDVHSYAAFTDGTINISDRLHAIAGGRLTYDKASSALSTEGLPNVYPLGPAINGPGSADTHATDFSWRLGLRYDLSDRSIVYATASRGYKGPLAIAVPGSGARLVKPETVQAYEIGLKTTLLDRKLRFNLAAFYEKFTNFQTSVLDTALVPPSFVLGNAGGLRTQGIEMEIAATPVRGLSLDLNGTYQDAKFTDFKATCYDANEPIKLATTTNSTAVGACYTLPGTSVSYVQAAGRPAPNASKWNLSAAAAYKRPVNGSLTADGNVNVMYRSKFFSNGVDPNTQVNGYATVNLSVGLGSSDERWRVGVFVRNLFDQYFISGIEPGAFESGALTNIINPEARRTIGVTLDTKM
jgi:iron complex outermembrane receptor protein